MIRYFLLFPPAVTTLRPEIGKVMYDDHKQVGWQAIQIVMK